MITIAVIADNDANFNGITDYLPDVVYRDNPTTAGARAYIESVIKPHITFHQVSDFLDFVCTTLAAEYSCPTEQLLFHTETTFCTPKGCAEIIYCSDQYAENKSNKPMNQLASLLSLKHTVIKGKCIVVLNGYNPLRKINITLNHLVSLYKRRFFYSGILIKPNGQLHKYYYQDVRYLLHKLFDVDINDDINTISFELMHYPLNAYFFYKQSVINPLATKLNGMYRLHGNVLITHHLDAHIPTNLSRSELSDLLKVAHGRLYDRQVKDNEAMTETVVDTNGQQQTKALTLSRYSIVNNRLKTKLWKQCINCNGKLKHICERCYRVGYCSVQCQTEYRGHHYDDCINELSVVPK